MSQKSPHPKKTYAQVKSIYGELLQFLETQKWLRGLSPDDKKVRAELRSLELFTRFTKLNPKELIDLFLSDSEKDPRNRTNIIKQHILSFKEHLINNINLTHNSAITYVGHIRGFFTSVTEAKIIFSKKDRMQFKPDKGRRIKRFLTKETIKEMINHTKIFRDQAIILCLASSGMPIGDLLELRYRDITQDYNNPREDRTILIDFNRRKTKVRYATFFSPEAFESLQKYFRTERPPFESNDEYVFCQIRNKSEKLPLDEGAILKNIKEIASRIDQTDITPYTFRRFWMLFL